MWTLRPAANRAALQEAQGGTAFGSIDRFSGRCFWRQTTHFTTGAHRSGLETVRQQKARPIVPLQDGAAYQRAAALRPFVAAHAAWSSVYQLPGYWPGSRGC
jgi:hypothetical protein